MKDVSGFLDWISRFKQAQEGYYVKVKQLYDTTFRDQSRATHVEGKP